MDLKSLLGPSATASSSNDNNQKKEERPELKKKHSTISYLVNNDDDISQRNFGSSSPSQTQMNSPVLNRIPSSSVQNTPTSGPSGHTAQTIKARSSISSLTNDTDVDLNGRETPSTARRLSYEISASESNSPVLPKKTILRQSSVQSLINTDIPETKEETSTGDISTDNVDIQSNGGEKSIPKKSPQTLESELNKLEALERSEEKSDTGNNKSPRSTNKKHKPKRYSKPPVWAQRWIPQSKKVHQQSTIQGSSATDSKDPSLTGIKPYNDITRKITQWIWAQIHNVPKEDRQFLELEVKFGHIWEKKTDRRIHLPIMNECIIDDGYMLNCQFKAGLDKLYYEKIKKYLTGLTKLHPKKFQTFKTDQIDKQFREGAREQIPRSYRLTYDKATHRIVANIEKRKLASLHIHSPDLLFDYRLTMSLELNSKENPERFEHHTPEVTREKRRISILHDLTATKFDLTEVVQTEKNPKIKPVDTREVELEIDTVKLVDAYDRLDEDQFVFEELAEKLMDNSRILNREVAKDN